MPSQPVPTMIASPDRFKLKRVERGKTVVYTLAYDGVRCMRLALEEDVAFASDQWDIPHAPQEYVELQATRERGQAVVYQFQTVAEVAPQ